MTKKVQALIVNTNAGLNWQQQLVKSGIQMAIVMVVAIGAAGDYNQFMAKGPIQVLWTPFFAGLATTLGLFIQDNVGATS